MTLPISTFVDINTSIAAGGVLRTEFGTGLLITTDDALPAGGTRKAQLFADFSGVNEVLDDGPALRDAGVWFAADPSPKSLYIGRWATADVSTTLRGRAPGEIADLAVANAAFRYGGNEYTVDLSGQTTYAGIATIIDSALTDGRVSNVEITNGGAGYTSAVTVTFSGGGATRQATGVAVLEGAVIVGITISDPGQGYTSAPTVTITDAAATTAAAAIAEIAVLDQRLAGATFTYDVDAFLLTLTGAADIGPRFETPNAGTDVSALLGMAAGTNYRPGHDRETLVDAIGEMTALASGTAPVALMLGSDAPAAHDGTDSWEALAAFAQSTRRHVAGVLDTSDAALETGDTTSRAAQVFANQQSYAEPIYSMPGERPDIGLLALMSSQNLNLPASIITPHLKPLPGVMPTTISEAQRAELERKRTNVYTVVGGLPSLVGGFTGRAGSWLDAIWWLLWLQNEMEINIFNAQRAARRFNTAILTDVIGQVMATATRSGGLQVGGRLNAGTRDDVRQTTGNQDFDGTLVAGWTAWIERPNERSDLDRENRIGRFKLWMAPADAIHRVTGDLVLSG